MTTQTVVLYRPVTETATVTAVESPPVIAWGAGRILSLAESSRGSALTDAEELAILARIEALPSRLTLSTRIESFMAEVARADISRELLLQWVQEVSSESAEDLALSIGVLVVSIFDEILSKKADPVISSLRRQACTIIKGLLPDEEVEAFLEACAEGLMEKQLLEEQAMRDQTLKQLQVDTIVRQATRIEAQIQTAYDTFFSRLESLKDVIDTSYAKRAEEFSSLRSSVERVEAGVGRNIAGVETLAAAVNAEDRAFASLLEKANKITKGVK